MRTNTKVLFDKTTMGGTTKVISPIINLAQVYCYAIQHIAAGTTASGSLQLYGSCDEGLNELGEGVVNWAAIDSAVSISSLTSAIINKDGIGYKWFKCEYTPASGTGTFTVILNTKG